eukprot:3448825-Rhodomonas_salina.2
MDAAALDTLCAKVCSELRRTLGATIAVGVSSLLTTAAVRSIEGAIACRSSETAASKERSARVSPRSELYQGSTLSDYAVRAMQCAVLRERLAILATRVLQGLRVSQVSCAPTPLLCNVRYCHSER